MSGKRDCQAAAATQSSPGASLPRQNLFSGYQAAWPIQTGPAAMYVWDRTSDPLVQDMHKILYGKDEERNANQGFFQKSNYIEKSTQISTGICCFHLLSEYAKTSSSLRNRLFSTLSLIPQLYWQLPFLSVKRIGKFFVFHVVFIK